jgi:Activator of Hsp90 ATPase homolog 1-like protein
MARDTTGDGVVGGTIQFRFGDTGGFDMKVLDQRPNERVEGEVTDGPAEWIGTHVSFDLKQEGDYTIVLFKHEGWREPVEFMSHCSTKWATFLMSLRQLVETGTVPHTPRTSGSATGTDPNSPFAQGISVIRDGNPTRQKLNTVRMTRMRPGV